MSRIRGIVSWEQGKRQFTPCYFSTSLQHRDSHLLRSETLLEKEEVVDEEPGSLHTALSWLTYSQRETGANSSCAAPALVGISRQRRWSGSSGVDNDGDPVSEGFRCRNSTGLRYLQPGPPLPALMHLCYKPTQKAASSAEFVTLHKDVALLGPAAHVDMLFPLHWQFCSPFIWLREASTA